jgi:hypothetical protein
MKFDEYKILAEKTLSNEFHSDKKVERILHASLGLATEIEELLINYNGEMDKINILEEMGDACWYVSIYYREYPNIKEPIEIEIENSLNPKDIIMDMLKSILRLQDIIKKKIFYNKTIDENAISTLVSEIDIDIRKYLKLNDIRIEDVWERNINKLRARYGEKFSSERAITRDLETEREILEGGSK